MSTHWYSVTLTTFQTISILGLPVLRIFLQHWQTCSRHNITGISDNVRFRTLLRQQANTTLIITLQNSSPTACTVRRFLCIKRQNTLKSALDTTLKVTDGQILIDAFLGPSKIWQLAIGPSTNCLSKQYFQLYSTSLPCHYVPGLYLNNRIILWQSNDSCKGFITCR